MILYTVYTWIIANFILKYIIKASLSLITNKYQSPEINIELHFQHVHVASTTNIHFVVNIIMLCPITCTTYQLVVSVQRKLII